jgi:magnesium transporter
MKRKAGQPPGELISPTDEASETIITVRSFNEQSYTETTVDSAADITGLLSSHTTDWIHISGFKNTSVFREVGELFNINPLTIEDALNHEHLPKAEEIDNQLFLILKSIGGASKSGEFEVNHLGFILQQNLLISFSRHPATVFDVFINRIQKAVGKIRQRKEDFIFYRLIDIVIDHYFGIFEQLEEEIFAMETKLTSDELENPAEKIVAVKKDIFNLKKNLLPSLEAVLNLLKSENGLIKKQTRSFFSDVIDHLRHLIQNLDGYRESAISLMELHMANNANRMNEVMKTLTLIATIFIPLTFLAGIYGMNFQYMPELQYKWAYPVLMSLMLILGVGMYVYMKRRKWF